MSCWKFISFETVLDNVYTIEFVISTIFFGLNDPSEGVAGLAGLGAPPCELIQPGV